MSPIKDPSLYPANWEEIRARVLRRAQNRCEWCGVKNGGYGYRDDEGNFVYLTDDLKDLGGLGRGDRVVDFVTDKWRKIIRIVLTCAHLDQDPSVADERRIVAICQKCHLDYDRPLHIENARKTRDRKRGQGVLFG